MQYNILSVEHGVHSISHACTATQKLSGYNAACDQQYVSVTICVFKLNLILVHEISFINSVADIQGAQKNSASLHTGLNYLGVFLTLSNIVEKCIWDCFFCMGVRPRYNSRKDSPIAI